MSLEESVVMKAADLIRIIQFSDSVLPVGAFTFSNGVESAIQTGSVHDVVTLKGFVLTSLRQAARCDCVGVVAAHRAALAEDYEAMLRADRAVNNRKLNEESRLMTTRMGKKLAEMSLHVDESPLVRWWLQQIKSGNTAGTYPVTQGVIMSTHGISARDVVVIHQYGVAMTILSAAMRLMRVTHLDTQRILFELNQDIETFCDIAESGDIEQMSSYVPVIDVLASLHLKAHVRLFMN
ncbi:urease accessory protein UreF [Pseudomonas chlororaphis subsp. piscium]|nr:urease accessory protein UreF [Pseudomonas chlororaphis subsp. piscium]